MFKALFSASHLGIRTAAQFVIVLTAGSVGLSVAASSASSELDAIANTQGAPTVIESGFLSLTQVDGATGAGFSATLNGMIPNDVRNFYVNVVNGAVASKALTISAEDTLNTVLTEDATKSLRVSISRCTDPWTGSACAPGATEILSERAVSTINTGVSGGAVATLVAGDIAANSTVYLRITLKVPNIEETTINGGAPGATSIQSKSDQLNWTLRVTQRTGTTENK